jgi:hypothetical protein
MVAYFVACAVTLQLLWDGHFSAREAGLLVVLYAAYLLICIGTSRYSGIFMMAARTHWCIRKRLRQRTQFFTIVCMYASAIQCVSFIMALTCLALR